MRTILLGIAVLGLAVDISAQATVARVNPPLTTAAIASRATPATVTIIAINARGDTLGQGSGFLVNPNGTIVTNWHVLKGASRAVVLLATRERFDRVSFLDGDEVLDIALIKIPGYELPSLATRSSVPNPGERVVAIGSPLGLSRTVTEGIVSATRMVDGRELVQISAAISPGSSGGAVLDGAGRVFAISSSYLAAGQQLNFAIPVRYAIGLLDSNLSARPLDQVFATGEASTLQPGPTTASNTSNDFWSIPTVRSREPLANIEGVYLVRQEWKGPNVSHNRHQVGLLVAGARDGWFDIGWTSDDSIIQGELIFRATNIRTNASGTVAFTAGNVTYDGFQTADSGMTLTATVASENNLNYELSDRLKLVSLPLSENTGLYDAQVRTRQYDGKRQVANVDWTGEIAVAQLRDSVYIDLKLANSSGGSTGLVGWSTILADGSFHLTGISNIKGDKSTFDLQGILRAGVLDAFWIDDRKTSRFEGPLHATRK